ncbi:MAG: hypothetical protein AABN95_09250 [Acidobacteriota bacterium]
MTYHQSHSTTTTVLGFAHGKPQNPAPTQQNPNNPANQRIVACVASVVGRYLGREALTVLKQQGLNAGIGLGVLGGRFLSSRYGGNYCIWNHDANGSGNVWPIRFHFRGAGFLTLAAGAGLKFYPRLVRESFNNKREGLRALRACWD